MSDNGLQVAHAIQNGSAIAVSDGSLKDGIGSVAFIITSSMSGCNNPIFGALPIPGAVKDGDSHRCELSGLYGIVCTVQCLVATFEISSGGLHVACDNEQALHIFDPNFLPDPQQANFNLLNALCHLIRTSSLTWTCEHVRRHQDSRKCHKPLSSLKQLNVQMDKLAEHVRLHYMRPQTCVSLPPSTCIAGEGWHLWQGSTKITDPTADVLYLIMQDGPTQMWWKRHGHLSLDACVNIDWTGTEDMMSFLQPSER